MKKLYIIVFALALSIFAPTTILAGQTFDIGNTHSLAIAPDGTLWSWGNCLLSDATADDLLIPIHILDDVTAVSLGDFHAMAIRGNGTLFAWGSNSHGQLGRGENSDHITTPTWIMSYVTYVSAGFTHTAAIRKDNSLWTWGNNRYGQLGNNSFFTRTPQRIMDDVIAVSAGLYQTFAITDDGNLWGWGSNHNGQITGASTENPAILEPVFIMDNVVAIESTGAQTFAIRSDGSLWGWGDNGRNFLGIGITDEDYTPPVKIMDDVIAIASSGAVTLAITSDYALWGWGLDLYELATNQATAGRIPFAMLSQTDEFYDNLTITNPTKLAQDVIAVSTSVFNAMFQKQDGSIWAWGNNINGQIGNGTTTDQPYPIPVFNHENTKSTYTMRPLVHFSQQDVRWANDMFGGFTMGDGGCGPTSIAMVASTLHGTQVLPSEVAAWGQRFYVPGVGASHALFTSQATQDRFNLTYRAISIHDDDAILAALRDGAMIITSVQSSRSPNARAGNQGIFNPVGLGGHIAVIYGITPDNQILLTSPRFDIIEQPTTLDIIRRELHSGVGVFWTYTANDNEKR